MSIDTITKKEWTEYLNLAIDGALDVMLETGEAYNQLVQLSKNYRKDNMTHHLIYKMDVEKGILTYKKGTKRNIGFNRDREYKQREKKI